MRGLGAGGKLYTFEYAPKHAEVARESFKRAGGVVLADNTFG